MCRLVEIINFVIKGLLRSYICRGWSADRKGGVVNKLYRSGEGSILFTSVVCNGDEESFLLCKLKYDPADDCTHDDDLAIICYECKYIEDHIL